MPMTLNWTWWSAVFAQVLSCSVVCKENEEAGCKGACSTQDVKGMECVLLPRAF